MANESLSEWWADFNKQFEEKRETLKKDNDKILTTKIQKRRVLYISDDIWFNVVKLANQKHISHSSAVQLLLRQSMKII